MVLGAKGKMTVHFRNASVYALLVSGKVCDGQECVEQAVQCVSEF